MKQRIGLLCAALSVLVLMFTSGPATAQDLRGTIKGSISDSSGGALPGVTVTVTNTDTNIPHAMVTDARGTYQVGYLNSGTYMVEAELAGFGKVARRGLQVRLGDILRIDLTLAPGGLEETVTVTAQAPLLDTTSPVTGQVIDSNQIERLPLGDGTAYMLTRLAPGVIDSSDLHFSRPMDNGNLAGIAANGALGGNDFTMDGAPNRVSPNTTQPGNNSGVVGFSPPSVAISEFKVQTNAFDAQVGHSAGATVNVALRSGTNAWQGSTSYYNRSDSRSMTPLLSKRAGTEKPTREYDRFNGMFSGPIFRDRTFFMVSFERLKDIQPEPASYTVPTAKMRAGDLSEWGSVVIYDPLTASGSTNARKPFAGNIIPANRINPIAAAYASFYPEPNAPGLEDNYFTNQLRPYDYNALLGRIDHNVNNSHRLFIDAYWNKREEDRYNWAAGAPNATGAGAINGFEVTHGFDFRSNTGATIGTTSLISDNLVLDVIGSWSKFGEWRKAAQEFDPAELGFSSEVVKLMGGYKYLPFITFGGFSSTNSNSRIASLGAQRSDFGTGFDRPFTNISFVPTASWLRHNHSVKGGYELRYQRWQINNAEYGGGRFYFNGAYTRLNNSAPTNVLAQSWAQFLLGYPTTGTNTVAAASTASQFEIAADADYRQITHTLFAQDDWQVNQSLTLNFGMRVEMQRGMTEVDDRNLSGFDMTMANPIEAQAVAAYAANPAAQLPVGQFKVKGGLLFADGAIYDDLIKPLPRAAFSYLLNPKTVIRGGLGLFSYTYYFDAGNQLGFSQPTGIITTENNGATFLADLSNPLPGGSLIQPPGSSLGPKTGLGLTLGTVVPSERDIPYYTRWQIGGQRDIGAGWMVEMFYVGSRGKNLPVVRELNNLPIQYLSTSRTRDTANESFLTQQVKNPFLGLMPGTALNGSTISLAQLLRPYPQYLLGANNGAVSGTGTISVGTEEYVGSDQYDAGSLKIQKRFTNGNSLLATYTRSRMTDKLNYLNPADGVLEDRTSPNDRPHRATVGATFDLPFGRGKMWGGEWKGLLQAALGGWAMSTTYQYQSGFPLTWNSSIYYDPNRDPRDLRSNIGEKVDCGTAGLDCPAWDTTGFYIEGGTGRTDSRIQLGNNVRYFPSTLPHVRSDDLHLMDVGIYKNFSLPKGLGLQVRIEAINALNYTVLWNPNLDPTNASFGKVNTERNNPRDIQLGAKLSF